MSTSCLIMSFLIDSFSKGRGTSETMLLMDNAYDHSGNKKTSRKKTKKNKIAGMKMNSCSISYLTRNITYEW